MAEQGPEARKTFTDAERKKLADSGAAMPDGSFPIQNAADLSNAIQAVGRASNVAAAKAHIKKRAAALGLTASLPDSWRSKPEREVERRFTAMQVELRAADGDSRVISGYAAVYNKRSHNLGGFVEQVDPAAFNKSRGDGWPGVVARFNHDSQFVLGTTAAGTVQLDSDSQGLRYSVDPPQTRQDVVELVQRGDVSKSSFAFRCFEDNWDDSEGVAVRTLGSVQLIDVAPVVSPAYPDATAGLRSLARQMDAPYDEVRSAAEANELMRFFRRTDQPSAPRRMSWLQAQVQLKRRAV